MPLHSSENRIVVCADKYSSRKNRIVMFTVRKQGNRIVIQAVRYVARTIYIGQSYRQLDSWDNRIVIQAVRQLVHTYKRTVIQAS